MGLSVPERYIGGSSAGLDKAQRIDSSLRADWLSCFSLAWWEWWVARRGCLVPLRKEGMWLSSRPANFLPAGLTLWPNWLERWLTTLSRLSTQVQIPVGLSVPGLYTSKWKVEIGGVSVSVRLIRKSRWVSRGWWSKTQVSWVSLWCLWTSYQLHCWHTGATLFSLTALAKCHALVKAKWMPTESGAGQQIRRHGMPARGWCEP